MFWDSIRNIGKDCVVGNTPPLSPALQSRILFDWGEKELYTKTSKPLVEKIWPGAGSLSVPEWSTARQWRRYRITQSRLKNGSTKRRNTTRWTFLNTLCDSFPHGYLLAELHSPFVEKNSKHHDAAKHTNASFGWGTRSGTEYLELEPRMTLVSEKSYYEEMKKYTIRGKLFAIIGKNLNNRLAVYRW